MEQQEEVNSFVSLFFVKNFVKKFLFFVKTGILADRFGRKPIFVIGFFWVAFFGGMTALAPEFWSFFFMRAFSGIGLGAATPISVTWLLEFGDFKARGSISGGFSFQFYMFFQSIWSHFLNMSQQCTCFMLLEDLVLLGVPGCLCILVFFFSSQKKLIIC